MKLYFSPGACSLSPHIVLHELGLPHESEKVDLKTKVTASGADFRTVNPKGQVPTLQLDDGSILTEGPVIVQYLADLKPQAGLVPPAGTMARYRLQEWLNHITSELHKGFSPLFNPATPEAYRTIAIERLTGHLARMDAHLAKNAYVMGDGFSVADAYLFTVLGWAGIVKLDLTPYANLQAFADRVRARPAVKAAMVHEGLIKA